MDNVSQLISTSSNRAIANQFIVSTPEGVYFQSYKSKVVFAPYNGKVQLDIDKWNYSRTTGRYRNQFLGETTKETQKKIDNGTYELSNLNT